MSKFLDKDGLEYFWTLIKAYIDTHGEEIHIGRTPPTDENIKIWIDTSGDGTPLTVTGISPLAFTNAVAENITSLIQYGKCAQSGTPTPEAPVDIMCNNGAIRLTNFADLSEENIVVGKYITPTGEINGSVNNFYAKGFIKVEPNTPYRFMTSESISYLNLYEYDADYGFLQRTQFRDTANITLTTDANTHYLRWGANAFGREIDYADITAIIWVLTDGELETVGTPEVLSVGGLNIFYNDEAWEQGLYLTNGKVAVAGANRTFITRCSPNTTYYWKHCSLIGGVRAFTVDADTVEVGVEGTWIKQNPVIGEINEVYSATTGANAKWLCVCFGRSQGGDAAPIADQWSDFMLSTIPLTADTPYKAYQTPQTVSVVSLYAVGDYKDEQDIVRGPVTRRVGVKALDGTETWGQKNATDGRIIMRLNNAINQASAPIIVTHGRWSTSAAKDSDEWRLLAGPYLCCYSSLETTDDFKVYLAAQYAQGTPIIVIYPLAEEQTEQADPQPIIANDGDNVITVNSAVGEVELKVEYLGVE